MLISSSFEVRLSPASSPLFRFASNISSFGLPKTNSIRFSSDNDSLSKFSNIANFSNGKLQTRFSMSEKSKLYCSVIIRTGYEP